jgi:DNA repair protein RecO (recombination protein O)
MALHSTDAIVLRRYPFRETSVIVSCLTPDFGKIKGLIKGLRAAPGRYRSAMEPITRNRIVFYDTHASQLHLISQCDLLDDLSRIQEDLDTARLAAFFVDLAQNVVGLEDPQPKLYALLRDALERLSIAAARPQELRLHVVLRMLRLAGFQPQVDQCTSCRARAVLDGFWSGRQGGLLCKRCLHEDTSAEPMAPEQLSVLQRLSDEDADVAVDGPTLQILGRHLDEFLNWRLDRPLRSQRMQPLVGA